MKITDFLESKEIKLRELEDNFEHESTKDIDGVIGDKCPNCGNSSNLYSYNSEPWTSVKRCISCNRIMIVIYTDKMGSVALDTLMIFKERQT